MPSDVLNLAMRDRDDLEEANYVRKADPNSDYWIDFSERKMPQSIANYGDDFSLIIIGDKDIERDFFVIPYSSVRHMLRPEALAIGQDNDNRRRWIGNVLDSELKITNCEDTIDAGRFYGSLLTNNGHLPDGDDHERTTNTERDATETTPQLIWEQI